MGNSAIEMDLTGEQPSLTDAQEFLELWNNCDETIEAYTSGSTGQPKQIKLLKSDMIQSAKATCAFFNINDDSTLFLPLSTDYIAGKMMIVRAICSGASIIVENPSNNPLRQNPGAELDLVAVVPSQLPGLLESEHTARIRNLIIGGAPLSGEQEHILLRNGLNAYGTYGMTETCSHVALRKIGEENYKALDDITFSVDSRDCLIIHSEVRSFGSLVTNDLVEIESPTSFRWIGRYDNIINSGGIKVCPEIVERKISTLISGRSFYISSRPSSRWGDEVILVIEGNDRIAGLEEKLRGVLDKAERPKEIIYRHTLSYTKNGKIKRSPNPKST